MKRTLIFLSLLLAPNLAMACDTFTSVKFKPGARTITYAGSWEDGFTLRYKGKARHFTLADAGTGTKTIVGIPDDKKGDAAQVKTPKSAFWLGPEQFVEYCN